MFISNIILFLILTYCKYVISKTPNVLFIIIDDLKPALGCYGDPNAHTPNIDNLAEKSFIFKNAFAQQALCGPSRNSLLTSRRPDSLHLYDFYSYWRSSVGNFTTLPQHFKENGYYTYSIGKVFHPGISSNFTDDYPYSWSIPSYHSSLEKYMNAKVCVDKNGQFARNLICPVVLEQQPEGTLPDLESLEEALHFLQRRSGFIDKKPFLLAVGFHKPHVPFRFPWHYLDYHPLENITLPLNKWKPYLLPDVAWNPWNDIRSRDDMKQLNISFPFGPMPDLITKKIIQAYNAATTYIDELIGKLLKHIDNNTIVVLTGDHGWSRGEHGEFAKYSNFDEATKVPLLIHVPGLSTHKIILNNLVELADLFPTLVDLTQVSDSLKICPQNKLQNLCTEGQSLVPIMAGASMAQTSVGKSAVFSQYPRPGPYPTKNPSSDEPRLKQIRIMGYSIRTYQYRYTEWVAFDNKQFRANWSKVYGRELYDHLFDPQENINMVNRYELTDLVKSLRHKLILGWRYGNQ